jgi:predicted phosphatase
VDKKHPDPTPEQFDSYEEAAEFWDAHDTTDYLDEFHTVDLKSELHARRFEIELEEDIVKELQSQAKQRGMSVSHLASDLLRRQLQSV